MPCSQEYQKLEDQAVEIKEENEHLKERLEQGGAGGELNMGVEGTG